MKTTYHYDRQLGKMVEGRAPRKTKMPDYYIIDDIEPYEAMAGDVAGEYITSRSEHRRFLRRNNFEEVGNEKDYFFRYGGKTYDNRS